MKKKFSKEFIIGLSVVLSLLVLIFGIDYLKGINIFKAANYYYVSYSNVSGLAQSAPVTINGYKVGLVREINYEYDNPGHVLVELSLDKKLQLTQGTEAAIVTDMLGTSSIELRMKPGNNFHVVGDKLVGVQTTGLMESISTEVLPNVGSIMGKVDSLLVAITAVVTDPALLESVKRLDEVMANLQKSTAKLDMVMSKMPAVAEDAKVTMANVKTVSDNFTSVSADLAVVASQLKEAPVDSALTNVYEVSESLKNVMKLLDSRQSSLGMLIHDPGFYNNLNSSVAHLDSLLIDVKKNPKRYISIKLL